jgi:hypothetical protein
MIKLKSFFIMFVLVAMGMSFSTVNIYAFSSSDLAITPKFQTCIPEVSYSQSTLSEIITIYDSGELVNNTNTTQSYSASYSRTISSSITVGGYVEFNEVVAKVGVSAEIGVNASATITETITANVLPHTTVTWYGGTKFKKSIGMFTYLSSTCAVTYKYNVTTKYSFMRYVQWD